MALLAALFASNLLVNTSIYMAAGDVATAISECRKAPTFLALQESVPYDWWLLAQVWLLKLAGLLSLPALKISSATWTFAGFITLCWMSRRILQLGWTSTLVALLFYTSSTEVMTWGRYGFNRYAASITLGGLTLALSLRLMQSRIQPSARLTTISMTVFAAACLYAPPAAFLIAAGLGVAWIGSLKDSSVSDALRRLMLCVLIGLPAALICIPTALLYPHVQMGNPPDYARHLFLEPGWTWPEAASFVFLRMGTLTDSVFGTKGDAAMAIVVIAGLLAAAGAVIPWIMNRPVTHRAIAIMIILSLVPAAVLSLYAWYPFGWVRYEYYACIPLIMLAGLGAEQLIALIQSTRVLGWPARNLFIAVVGCATVFAILSQTSRLKKNLAMSAQIRSGFIDVKDWIESNADCPVIIDYYTDSLLNMADIRPQHVLFTIPRSTIRNGQTIEATVKKFRNAIKSHSRVGLISYYKFEENHYAPFVEIMSNSDFLKSKSTPGRWRLTVWNRQNKNN